MFKPDVRRVYMWGAYKHIVGSGMLAVVLDLPFDLKLLSKSLEVYPSVVAPAGANVVKTDGGCYDFLRPEILGFDLSSNDWRPLANDEFIFPVPVHFLPELMRNEFGFNPELKTVERVRGGYPLVRRKYVRWTESEREGTRAWLRSRLRRLGCDESRLLLRTVAIGTRDLQTVRVINEKILALR